MYDQNLLIESYWVDKLADYNSINIGFSGGLDSTVLLHLLASIPVLANKLLAVHVNHGLSADANAWQVHCEQYCSKIGVPVVISRAKLKSHANVEELARNVRYDVFKSLLIKNDCVVLAHHCNDQAETLLLNLLRGAGVDGLASMLASRPLNSGDLIRPFLNLTRDCLENYAIYHELKWIEDDSNYSLNYSRNYIRHEILPLLTKKWPKAIENIASCAKNCQNARSNLESLAALDCTEVEDKTPTISLDSLPLDDRSRLINVLRVWFKKNSIIPPSSKIIDRLVDEVVFARFDSQPCLVLGDLVIRRYRAKLYLVENNETEPKDAVWNNFPEEFDLNNDLKLTAERAGTGLFIPKNSVVEIKFRSGGETFQWHGQTKKLKKLFQQWGVLPWQRDFVPLIFIDGCLKAVVGFASLNNLAGTEDSYNITLKNDI
jgi:tRNA(Ile)-lysidine synthase